MSLADDKTISFVNFDLAKTAFQLLEPYHQNLHCSLSLQILKVTNGLQKSS